jgi:AraC family transcriptional regulator of adaptative response/methylated-DNA-[protein]-cysteine methyltransferase
MNTTTARRWWKATVRRDPAFDGTFVFGVLTTGIYCRPSCPARRPLARNVRFFAAARDAEREGFRACKRCGVRPSLAVRACDYLLRHVRERVPLARLARSLGVSASHLQRSFTRTMGVSPATYARTLRFEQFRTLARGPVAPALYGAGFGAPSRLYERARVQLGMTPAASLRGGKNMCIAYEIIGCPLGRALIAATPLGICAVEFGDSDGALAASLRARYPRATIDRNPALLTKAGRQLRRIFEGKTGDAALPLDVRATVFQARVWNELRAIPAGATRSYSEIARRIGSPTSARAVARACASNPLALLIPCHRAVAADGALSGYRWGTERKRKLLNLERATRRSGR